MPQSPTDSQQRHQPGGSQEQQKPYGRNRSISASSALSRPVVVPPSSPPRFTTFQGRTFIPPSSPFAHAIIMGNEASVEAGRVDDDSREDHPDSDARQGESLRPASNLTMLLNQHHNQQQQQLLDEDQPNAPMGPHDPSPHHHQGSSPSLYRKSQSSDEADSASGPPPDQDHASSSVGVRFLGSSAPSHLSATQPRTNSSSSARDPRRTVALAANASNTPNPSYAFLVPGGTTASATLSRTKQSPDGTVGSRLSSHSNDRVRRCMSSKELGTIAPPSGSPYAYMLYKKEQLEVSMRQRLLAMREAGPPSERQSGDESQSSNSSRLKEGSNQLRQMRRAQHNEAIVQDLCNVVADLFIAESKLLKPFQYGVVPIEAGGEDKADEARARLVRPSATSQDSLRQQVVQTVHQFVAALPTRYALSADTPSEVLLHMRIMAAARADKHKVVVHIHSVSDAQLASAFPAATASKNVKQLRLVTICCNDANGLLEYISKLLATGGSRVVDADVMLSTDGIVLDRFLVEMNGRLRMDRLADRIEAFLKEQLQHGADGPNMNDESLDGVMAGAASSGGSPLSSEPGGPLYYQAEPKSDSPTRRCIEEEIQSAVPLTHVLASRTDLAGVPSFPKLRKFHSSPPARGGAQLPGNASAVIPSVQLHMRSDSKDGGVSIDFSTRTPGGGSRGSSSDNRLSSGEQADNQQDSVTGSEGLAPLSARQRRPLVNRKASSNLDEFDAVASTGQPLDYVTIPYLDADAYMGENRVIPLIPFDELMLIETLGTGRVSTIYRAAWQRGSSGVSMVALKVAMINSITNDTSHVDELRREADIAARLSHPNICDLVGVAADQECFCLAYDFCEGGSLQSLLSNPSRYYEYLPIALDIANGMAYLHSRNLIHRDLKPSNILLTRDHRAKIADFGMSVAYTGQELTAETGTYRFMAPEVIRHESYSSNADVYSFGICLWQLITREVPFATMTPIQAAYAVAEGRRPPIPPSTPRRLQEIITACWDQDSHRRPSFTYIAMALADYARMAFSPANVGALTLQIANEMLESVEGNSNVNVDFSTPVAFEGLPPPYLFPTSRRDSGNGSNHSHGSYNVGLEIE